MIQLEDGYARAPVIGSNGVSDEDLASLAPEAREAHVAFEKRRASGAVGFVDAPAAPGVVEARDAAVASLPREVDVAVVLGIGGSSLGARALHQALAHPLHAWLPPDRRAGRRLLLPDNVDPATWAALADVLDPARTAFVAVSKSGSTVETLAHLTLARAWLHRALGPEEAKRRVLVVTGPDRGPLRELAKAEGLVALDVPPNVGGRWSVLTPVGLLPALLSGIDVAALLEGARSEVRAAASQELSQNAALRLAALHVHFDRRGRNIHVLMPYADGLRGVGEWFRQLWAESLGKRVEVGPTPIVSVGATDQHSQLQLLRAGPEDKLVTFVSVGEGPEVRVPEDPGLPAAAPLAGRTLGEMLDAERRATAASLAAGGRPSVTLRIPALEARSVGALLMHLMLATAYAAELYGVDAYDQPAVEEGKLLAKGLLGFPGRDAERERVLTFEGKGRSRP